MVTTEAGRALDDPAYHLSSCWLNSPNRTNEGCDCGHSELLAAIEAEAAAAERERNIGRLQSVLAITSNQTRAIGLRDAIAILAEPTIEVEHPGPKVLRGKRFDSVLTDD